jgi:hypothetical protein
LIASAAVTLLIPPPPYSFGAGHSHHADFAGLGENFTRQIFVVVPLSAWGMHFVAGKGSDPVEKGAF